MDFFLIYLNFLVLNLSYNLEKNILIPNNLNYPMSRKNLESFFK